MGNRVKKIKFKKGQDANQMLMHRLAADFVRHEHIETTLHKAKALKSLMDRLANRARTQSESHRNILLSALRDRVLVEKLFELGKTRFTDRNSGFVRLMKLGRRQGDGAMVARLEWVYGLTVPVKQEPKSEEVEVAANDQKVEEKVVEKKTPKKTSPKVEKPKRVAKPKKSAAVKKEV